MAINNIILKNLFPKPRYGDVAPLGNTAELYRFGYRPPPPEPPPTGVFFSENFDTQPDYTSAQFKADGTKPVGVYSMRIDADYWTPSNGHPDREECIVIDSTRAFGDTGKSAKFHRMSTENPTGNSSLWNSEDIMLWHFPEGVDQLYVEFLIRFDDDWTVDVDTGQCKLFRAFSWNGEQSIYQFFSGGNSGPIFLWDVANSATFGTRNFLAFRGGPWGDNYTPNSDDIGYTLAAGDVSRNWSNNLAGQGLNGTTPTLPDRLNGGNIPASGTVTHEQVYGTAGSWTKMAFWLKMNSAPNLKDGEFKQWINDKQVGTQTQVCWVKNPASGPAFMPKWNCVALGGNDFFHTYPNIDRRSEWYAIDNIVMRHDIPGGLS